MMFRMISDGGVERSGPHVTLVLPCGGIGSGIGRGRRRCADFGGEIPEGTAYRLKDQGIFIRGAQDATKLGALQAGGLRCFTANRARIRELESSGIESPSEVL